MSDFFGPYCVDLALQFHRHICARSGESWAQGLKDPYFAGNNLQVISAHKKGHPGRVADKDVSAVTPKRRGCLYSGRHHGRAASCYK